MQRLDESNNDFIIEQEDQEKDPKVRAVPKRIFDHTNYRSRFGSVISTSIDKNGKSTLNDEQLKQCGDAYINNGIVRGIIDRLNFFIQGDRTNFVIDPNDELTESVDDEEEKKLQQDIANDTLMITAVDTEQEQEGGIIPPQPARIKELRRKCIRLNKRLKLYQNIEKLLNSCLVFGMGALEIVRNPKNDKWPTYGEPIALRHLNTRKIEQVLFNERTGIFEGIRYNTGDEANPIKTIKPPNLVIGFHDDNTIYEGSQGTGLSAVWPILSISQSDDVINDEDIPESTRNLGAKFGFVFGDTNNESKLKEIENTLRNNSWMVVPPGVIKDVKTEDLGRDLMELPNVRLANAKYMCMCMNLPLFLLFEDTANFATANQVMQVFKAGVLTRYRTWLQGILEDYYYDTILADHLHIEVKDVIAAPIKIKATFNDINFETRSEIITGDKELVAMDVLNRTDVAKDIGRKDVVQRIEEEEAEEKTLDQKVEEKLNQKIGLDMIQKQQAQIPQEQQQSVNPQNNPFFGKKPNPSKQEQEASAAASVVLEEDNEIIRRERMKVLVGMQKVLRDINNESISN